MGDDEARQVSENASLAACAQYTLFVREFAEAGKNWEKGGGRREKLPSLPPPVDAQAVPGMRTVQGLPWEDIVLD